MAQDYICTKCVNDDALARVIRRNPVDEPCDFCNRKRKRVGHFDEVIQAIDVALAQDYDDPVNVALRDNESETGWACTVYDIYDLLADIGYEPAHPDALQSVIDAFSERQFCEKDLGVLSPTQRLRSGWEGFKEAVKHHRRFTFWSMGDDYNEPEHPDYFEVGDMLKIIGRFIKKAKLIKVAARGTAYWRSRCHKPEETLSTAEKLGAPPTEHAKYPNRMSPSGISMFYGCDEVGTTYAEIVDEEHDKGKAFTSARFTALRDLRILDLYKLPFSPSYFDVKKEGLRIGLNFLHAFARDIAKPIQKDDVEHIEYVPTQVFTEHVRFNMVAKKNKPIDGIRYRSSQDGKPCVVIFCGQDGCVPKEESWRPDPILEMDAASIQRSIIGAAASTSAT